MRKSVLRLMCLSLIMSTLAPIFAQDGLGDYVESLLEENGQSYFSPVATAFGTGMNSGTFHRAKPHKLLGFDVTLNTTLIFIPEEATTFPFLIPDDTRSFSFDIDGTVYAIDLALSDIFESDTEVPTFFGDDSEFSSIPVRYDLESTLIARLATESGLTPTQIQAAVGTAITAQVNSIPALPGPKGLWPLSAFITIMPQIAVGLPFGIEVMVRGYSGTVEGQQITAGGFGAKIGLNQFIPTIPLIFPDVSVGFYSTNLNLADIVEAKNTIINLQVSKSIPVLTVFGGFGIESSTLSANYNAVVDGITIPIGFDLTGVNTTRTTLGFRLKLFVLSINGEYNMGEYASANLGLGITFR